MDGEVILLVEAKSGKIISFTHPKNYKSPKSLLLISLRFNMGSGMERERMNG